MTASLRTAAAVCLLALALASCNAQPASYHSVSP